MRIYQKLICLIIGIILLSLLSVYAVDVENKYLRSKIECLGYTYSEVYTFCRYTDYLREDFIKSKAIRKQYELFKEGKVMFLKKDKFRGTIIKFNPKEMEK